MIPKLLGAAAVAAALVLGSATSSSLHAQEQVTMRDATTPLSRSPSVPEAADSGKVVPTVGPRVQPVGVVAIDSVVGTREPQDRNRSLGVGPNVAMMGVGAAAVAVGLLIGGDSGTLIAVGGGVIGLIGFYRFLR
jgi:hypothetical protein